MRGLLTILWHGDPDAEAVVVVCGGAMGGLLGPADGFYQWLGDELATRGSGIGVLRVGWRRPNDIDLCTLDLLAAADLAARAGAERFVTGGHSFGGAIAVRAGMAMGELDPRGGHLRHPVRRLRGGRGPDGAAARVPRRPRRDPARRSASQVVGQLVGGPADVRMCEGAGHLLTEARDRLRAEVPDLAPRAAGALRVDVDAAGREEHGHPPLRRHHPVVLRPVVVLPAAGRGVDCRAAAPGGRRARSPRAGRRGRRAPRCPRRPPMPSRRARAAWPWGWRGGGRSCGWPVGPRRRRRAAR